ncbi:MAG: enoyl-CoA hydratase/isomerase family protein [Acidobacteria bacterium]|nr:enoyl-CoA hydratase/isomerase family protein [Acidobacteriota bacterium]MCB9378251.1 enoyl-CoA hydratase/isomerase family protein [Holophagales bacterium]
MLEILDHDGGVRELRLARPPVNALDPALVRTLIDALAEAPRAGARSLVLSSAQPGLFSAGLDVPALLALDRTAMGDFLTDFFALMRGLAASPIPTVAAISGHSPAGGAVLAIHCDYRVMAAGAFKIGMNEVQVGLPLPESIHMVLARVVGVRQAERLGTFGLLISADEAAAIGLVDELVAPESVVPRALELARAYLALPPTVMARTRAMCRRDLVEAFDRLSAGTLERFLDDWFSAETRGALTALVERLAAKKKG